MFVPDAEFFKKISLLSTNQPVGRNDSLKELR